MAAKDTDDRKDDDQDGAMTLDMSQAAVKKMIAEARDRGYITYDQLNTVLPPEQVNSEQIEDVMSMLSEMGINVIEDEDEADEAEGGAVATTASGSREVAVPIRLVGYYSKKIQIHNQKRKNFQRHDQKRKFFQGHHQTKNF